MHEVIKTQETKIQHIFETVAHYILIVHKNKVIINLIYYILLKGIESVTSVLRCIVARNKFYKL